MITILALILVGYLLFRFYRENLFGLIGNIIYSLYILIIASLVIFLIWGITYECKKVETGRDNCNSLVYSLKNVDGIEGRFCLGSGYIGSQEYYYMFEKFNDGGLHRIKLQSRDCIIYQNEDKNPYIFWQKIHYRLPYWILWPNITKFNGTEDSMYDIHIPSNSVVLKFNVE